MAKKADTQRFEFPGFQFIGSQDTEKRQVITGKITAGKIILDVQLVRSRKVGEKGTFLPACLEIADKKWMFSDENFEGIAMLAMADKTPVIAFIPKGMKKVERIFPLEDISILNRLDVNGQVDDIGKQRPVLEVMRLKRLAGQYLGMGVIYSRDENKAFQWWLAEEAKKAEEFKRKIAEKAEAERKARIAERAKRVLSLCVRHRVKVFTDSGEAKFGTPVIEAEWPMLSDGKYAILVESYDEKTGRCGKAIEAFWVNKTRGGKLSRKDVISVSFEAKKAKNDTPKISAETIILIDRGKGPERAIVFKSPEGIKDAAQKGLNSGALVAVEVGNREFEVSSISSKRVSRVGTFSAI